jgi:hypothetical protein
VQAFRGAMLRGWGCGHWTAPPSAVGCCAVFGFNAWNRVITPTDIHGVEVVAYCVGEGSGPVSSVRQARPLAVAAGRTPRAGAPDLDEPRPCHISTALSRRLMPCLLQPPALLGVPVWSVLLSACGGSGRSRRARLWGWAGARLVNLAAASSSEPSGTSGFATGFRGGPRFGSCAWENRLRGCFARQE